ncbi:hypothetical protein DY251_12780 [Mesorhizobium denitrificans]|uniref:Uncharacterized protein n=2 Tax=Phyllobacteriaceae TaxID=69277 RepID=A0A371XD75_9HYPH|nr:hypothetical protein DY251_12780 [Mesorhizobium denitrificans]
MPLQNRVDPAGEIHSVPARGMFTGNRGVIHDPETKSLNGRRWTTKAWIICRCDFENRKRTVFGRNARSGGPGWTNLFFADEVTALAAGHRPCFECRRAEAIAFANAFARGHGLPTIKAAEMDAILHGQRLATGKAPQSLNAVQILDLPTGAIVSADGRYLAKRINDFRIWSFDGYGAPVAAPLTAVLITPPAIVSALRSGYRPVWHPTA